MQLLVARRTGRSQWTRMPSPTSGNTVNRSTLQMVSTVSSCIDLRDLRDWRDWRDWGDLGSCAANTCSATRLANRLRASWQAACSELRPPCRPARHRGRPASRRRLAAMRGMHDTDMVQAR